MSVGIKERLFSMRDDGYKAFHGKLMPGIEGGCIIGVRVPVLKKYAKELYGSKSAENFLGELPHTYYEENNLHAFLIGQIKDFELCVSEVEKFLPYVDNWATCDGLRPVCFKNNREKLLPHIWNWLGSAHTFTVRFGIEMLMIHFLDEDFKVEYADTVAKIKSDDYYVNMMIAWYFATALAKQWGACIGFIEKKTLSPWVQNKTVQKCVESYRISAERKEYLKGLKM